MKNGLKKVTLLAALAVGAFTFGANAQDASTPEKQSSFILGVRTGVNVNDFSVSGTTKSTTALAGAQATVFAMYNVNSWVGMSLEAGFSQSGAARFTPGAGRVTATPGGTTTVVSGNLNDYRLSNVQANLLSYFKLPVLSVYEPKVFIGPSFDFNVHATNNVEGYRFGSPTKYRVDATNQFKAMDIGMIIGTGVDFDLKWATLMLDARYRHGFTDINNAYGQSANWIGNTDGSGYPLSLGNQDIRTRGLSFQVGLGFKL
ncbi:porin family protein [Rhodoflexus caldus]|uniref:porin family protein n=1 Tax=Rhodoflexus caldus TaxID=2891236 RepID=UPI00202A0BAF|nr:porin family protein [Rhodoflexus caldus]